MWADGVAAKDQVGEALSAELLGSEPKFAEPSARPWGAAQRAAAWTRGFAKLVSDPNNSNNSEDSRGVECLASLILRHPNRAGGLF